MAPKAKAPPKKAPPKVVAPSSQTKSVGTRSELVRGVFDTFDKDCDDLLNPPELRKFADSVGFEGDEQEWIEWYRDTCSEVGANRKLGVDRAQFMKLIQDADDEDLVRLCGKRRPQGAIKHALILRSVFDVFDRDCDGLLNRVELRRFMDNLDFEGDDIEWDERYLRECKAVGADSQRGVDRSQFAEVAARSCSDSELDVLLQELQSLNEQPIAMDVWSKLQTFGNRASSAPVADDEGKIGEELVQSLEPTPPERSLEGQILAPEALSRPATSTPKKELGVALLDADEYELDNLRKALIGQNAPTRARMPSMKGNGVKAS